MKAVVLLLLLGGCGGGSPPRELSPGVVKSTAAVQLASARALDGVNILTDIAFTQTGDIVAVGGNGAAVLSATYSPLSTGRFEGASLFRADSIIRPALENTVVAVSTFDGNPQVAAFRLDGSKMWSYEEKNPLVSGTHGLLPELGRSGAVVVSHQQRGLLFLDSEVGSILKAVAAPFSPEVRTADLDGDGATEIAQLTEADRLELRTSAGRLVTDRKIMGSWAVVKGTGRTDALAVWDGTNLELLGPKLVTECAFPVSFPGSELASLHIEAAAAFRTKDEQWFAVLLGGRGGWHRTTFLVYQGAGQLAYHEILPDDFMSVRFTRGGSLLVGGRNSLRVYTIKHQHETPPN